MKETEGITLFENPTEAIVAVKNLTQQQKDYMLCEMVWRAFDRTETAKTPRQVLHNAFNMAKMIK